jgi:hypothetical protein
LIRRWGLSLGSGLCLVILVSAVCQAASTATVPAATAVIAGFLNNVAHWFEYVASMVALTTIAYGGIRVAIAHNPRAQADAWRVILAGMGGLLIALLAPTIVSIIQGMVPTIS